MRLKIKYEQLRRVIVVVALMLCCVACDKGGGDLPTAATLKLGVVSWETTVDQLLLSGSANIMYTATITQGVEWLSFAPTQIGVTTQTGVLTPVVFIYLQKNSSSEDRMAIVQIEFSNGDNYEVKLTQQKYSVSSKFDKDWAEQPLYKSNEDYIYKTYYTTLSNSQYVRNYSICYDKAKKVAHWVAYPLHRIYTMPNVGRTDVWAYDPNVQLPQIPQSEQQYVVESYRTGYARGHQCPSADRYSTIPTNEMTFYATNLMPQDSRFNGGIWSSLENKIRENIVSDTVFVVTGTYFGNDETTTDRRGNRMGLPTNCWKVLLRTKKGNIGKRIQDCSAAELIGIGFWFSNDTSNGTTLTQHSKSVAQIEELTGFTFFRNLPTSVEVQVKEQNNPADWGIK